MSVQKLVLNVRGMDCSDCARTIEKGVTRLEGVEKCEINLLNQQLIVYGDIDPDVIMGRVDLLGYKASLPGSEPENINHKAKSSGFIFYLWESPGNRMILISLLLILPGFILDEVFGINNILISILSISALILAGFPIFRSAYVALVVSQEININVLMSIASIGALAIGYPTEAAMVIVLFALGEALEGFTTEKARRSINDLMTIAPNKATILVGNNSFLEEKIVDVSALIIGDRVIVKPGERIPMDGEVLTGVSHINQAPITGESQLILKMKGDTVFASSTNYEGALEILVTHTVDDNTISRLVRLVEDSQENRAKTHRFVDQFAKIYTPVVVGIAFLVAFVPPLLFGQPFLDTPDGSHGWLYRALALLVVSCPCALVISTPVSIISSITNASGKGVIFKGGASVENLSHVKVMAFDKTGTLTYGNPKVVEIAASNCSEACLTQTNALTSDPNRTNDNLPCRECLELLILANAVERKSGHPLGYAIVEESNKWIEDGQFLRAENVTTIPGKGIVGTVENQTVVISSVDYFIENGSVSSNHISRINDIKQNGSTVITITVDGIYKGYIAVIDQPRHSTKQIMDSLRKTGVETIVMLTGDHSSPAEKIGEEIGITDIRANLLPEDKLNTIKQLQEGNKIVAMVGDGINDTPALSLADVGIAITGLTDSNDFAVEVADVILMTGDLRKISFAYSLSKQTMKTIIANIIFSIGIKIVFVILVLAGFSTMWMAVAADMGTSLLVTLNGMRLLKYSPPEIHED